MLSLTSHTYFSTRARHAQLQLEARGEKYVWLARLHNALHYTSYYSCVCTCKSACICHLPPNGNRLHITVKSTKVLNPRRCIMRVYTREIRMRVHEKYAWKMADCTHGRTTEGVLDLCNGAVSEKTPQIF